MTSDPATNPVKTLLGPSIWFAPGMSLKDLRNFVSGMEFSQDKLYKEFPGLTAWHIGTRYDLPFYIFQGDRDVLTPPDLAAEFFADVEAPVKEMALIEGAGHFACFTHPQQFLRLLLTHVLGVGKV